MLAVYALMAIPLKSYSQPLIIMSVIPFGIIGAVIGHWILGMPVSILSLFGIIALSGVVVNDSLVMVDYVNKAKEAGMTCVMRYWTQVAALPCYNLDVIDDLLRFITNSTGKESAG